MSYLLAVDGGSQSTKVSVVDEQGRVHAVGRAPLRPYRLGPGGSAVHPDDDLWDSLVRACRSALADLAGSPRDIVAIGLCGIRSCRALLDARGRPTEPVLSWMDARVSQPLPPPGPEVATVTSAGGYLAVRMTGQRRDSAASYTGMWPLDPVTRRWSREPSELARTGMSLALLPDLVDPGQLLGELTTEAALATGLAVGCPVVATANDKAVEALGCGVTRPGTLLLSLGTYVAAMTVVECLPAGLGGADPRVWLNAAAVPGGHLAESAGVRRGMWTVSWLRELLGAGPPPDAPRGAGSPEGGPGDSRTRQGRSLEDADSLDDLERAARSVPPGSLGLVTLPDWLAPADAPYRRGAFLGLDARHGPPELYRSVLEALVLTMRGHWEAMETALGATSAELVVSGGGARSALMRQIVADVSGRPVHRAAVVDAAGMGAAVCAAVGAGLHADVQRAAESMVRPGPVVEPDPAAVARYDEIAAAYGGIRDLTDPVFRRLAALEPPHLR